jgi:hypothetical protein
MSNCWKCGRELECGVECEDGCLISGGTPAGHVHSSPTTAAQALVLHTVEEMGADGCRVPVEFKGVRYEVIVRKVSP